MKLGEIIKKYRKAHNDESMETFAKRADLTRQYISLLEKGSNPNGSEIVGSMTTYTKVAKAMGITVDQLFAQINGDDKINVKPAGVKIPVIGKIVAGIPKKSNCKICRNV